MRCTLCQAKVKPDVSFCTSCGAPVVVGEAPIPQPAAPPSENLVAVLPVTQAPPPAPIEPPKSSLAFETPRVAAAALPPPIVSAQPMTEPLHSVNANGPRHARWPRGRMLAAAGALVIVTSVATVVAVRSSSNSTTPTRPDAAEPATTQISVRPTDPPASTTSRHVAETEAQTVTPSTTQEPPNQLSYPTNAPANSCNAATITGNRSAATNTAVACRGAWALTVDSECNECESEDIYRWTISGWTPRGTFSARCPAFLTDSGIPLTIAEDWAIPGSDCAGTVDRHVVQEPSSGSLERFDAGPRVRRLQIALADLGLLADVIDGEFGPNTKSAVLDFQYLVGLPADGSAGPSTHAALGLRYP